MNIKRPSQVRAYLEGDNMPVYEAPADDGDHAPRQTYNFAPGYNGIVYRADVPDHGAGPAPADKHSHDSTDYTTEIVSEESAETTKQTRYRLDSMRWGLIPFWTKRSPDFSSMIKTINCRDDSLAVNRGLWNSIKPRKRCVVVCQGFYEWLKDPHNPKQKTPHYVKRKDGKLMCMAGLWDCVRYEGKEERIYSYTVITTDSNAQLKFLHDRMPVILDNGGAEVRTWLDPERYEWNKELQSLLKPYEGELEVYPVSKEVGKVGNNSERFIIPVDSADNKANIANFFGGGKSREKKEVRLKAEGIEDMKKDKDEKRETVDHEGTEDNAPLPIPSQGVKREREKADLDDVSDEEGPVTKTSKTEENIKQESSNDAKDKTSHMANSRRLRSATSNGTAAPSPPATKNPSTPKITNFFGK